MSVTVRPATQADGETFVALVRKLAEYEKLEPPTREGEQRLLRDAFGAKPRIHVLIAEHEARAVAYAIYFETYSSFLAQPTLFLEDLFVLPTARGLGVGREIMSWLAREALARGCGRLEWQVLDWNQLAIGFYERLGATHLKEWLSYRLTGDSLARLANRE